MAGSLTPTLAGDTLEAIIQAYNDYLSPVSPPYKPTPPPGYTKYFFRFTGWEGIVTNSMVKYGLIFQSSADLGQFLVAFRGTQDDVEWLEDFDWIKTSFPGTSTNVAQGFLNAYTQGPTTPALLSMRNQLQLWLAQTKPTSLIITGHSLGGALASLFAYDVLLNNPIPVTFVSYASPNVGPSDWQTAFNTAYPNALRVFNTEDVVPYAPPDVGFGYLPVGTDWPVEFEPYYFWDRVDPVALGTNHSSLNYQYVVNLAVANSPQIYIGQFPDQSGLEGWTMGSWAPSAQRGALRLRALSAYLKALKAVPLRPA